MSTPVIRDVNHPDFPHGTALGRRRHCDCTPCRDAKYREDKRLHLQRLSTGSNRYASPEVTAKVLAHLEHLNSIPGVSLSMIGKWAGTSHSSAVRVMATGTVGPRLAKQFLSISAADAAARARLAPRTDVVLKVHQMQALGYPIAWQQEQIGRPRCLYSLVNRTNGAVEAVIAQAVDELARRVGDRPAVPGNGLTARAINHAKGRALKAGYYPPACYDEDGTLDYRSIPGHPWSKADEDAHHQIAMVRLLLDRDEDFTADDVAERLGVVGRTVTRMVGRAGLKMTQPGYAARVKEWRDRLDAFEDEATDPVYFALANNLIDPDKLPSDHPGFSEWWAEHPEWEPAGTRRARLRREAAAAADEWIADSERGVA